MKTIKIGNFYSGIGGNRKYWNRFAEENNIKIEVTAVEIDAEIAKIYQDFFPNDKVIIGDAHQYLLEHFNEFDFIWSSPPCPTHSKVRKQLCMKKKEGKTFMQNKPVYPDMKLYQETIFLDNYFDGLFVVENVTPFYEPLIEPQKVGRHCFWANFKINKIKLNGGTHMTTIAGMQEHKGFDISDYKIKHRKDTILRNCVLPELGLSILKDAFSEDGEVKNGS